jgi:hypothetical protein
MAARLPKAIALTRETTAAFLFNAFNMADIPFQKFLSEFVNKSVAERN